MRTLRLSGVGTGILVLLLGAVMACDVGDDRLITLEVLGERRSAPATSLTEAGIEQGTITYRAVVEASDPRLSGDWTVVDACRWDTQSDAAPTEELCVGRVRVENEGGTWVGGHEGYRREGIDNLDPTILEGQDGYAGLTAVLDYVQDGVTEPGKSVSGVGYIVDFSMPDPPESFTE